MAVTAPPPATLRDRVYGSAASHRLYPMALGSLYARYRTARWWPGDPLTQEHARLHMRFVTGCLDPAPDLDTLGRAYMFETLKREELSWRPWLTTAFRVRGIDALKRLNAGTGLILNFMHQGQYAGVSPSVARHGLPVHMASDPVFLDQEGDDYWTRRRRQHGFTISRRGARVFPAPGSYEHMRDLLRAGQVVALASDLPGRNEVTYLGRRVGAAGGAARLALDLGVPVVPITARRRRFTQELRIEDPVLPDDFTDHLDLLQELIRRHEPAIAAWPAAVERPLRRFAPVTPGDVETFGYEDSRYFATYRI